MKLSVLRGIVFLAMLGIFSPHLSRGQSAPVYQWASFVGQLGGPGYADGNGNAARFSSPPNVAADPAGNVYVADFGNNVIRKITPTGDVTTFAGTAGQVGSADGTGAAARFQGPTGVAVDASGNVFVADKDNQTIRMITPTGVVSTFAGRAGFPGSANGTGAAARFNQPYSVAVDSSGNVYVADLANYTIRKISPTGVVSTLAGSPGSSGSNNGTGAAARFSAPIGVAVDSSGTVYVADNANSMIRKITSAGVVTTLAGAAGMYGSADGTGSAARFSYPSGVSADSSGNIFVADQSNHTIRKVTPAGVVTTLAGTAGTNGIADGTGPDARFDLPSGVAADPFGNVYVADYRSCTIRKITSTGVVTTFAGAASSLGSEDGTGNMARFNLPVGLAIAPDGTLYVADWWNHALRKVTPAGVVTTLKYIEQPYDVAVDSAGMIYVPDAYYAVVRKLTPTGTEVPFFVPVYNPVGVAADSANNIYVTDDSLQTVQKITPLGEYSTLAGSPFNPGRVDGTGTAARFWNPCGLAADSSGNIFVGDSGNSAVRKVTPAGSVTTFAGTMGSSGSIDGVGGSARFYDPFGVAVDRANNVYITDLDNHTVRKITSGGVVNTIGGLAGASGGKDGIGTTARFNSPYDITVDRFGVLYLTDSANNRIVKGTPLSPLILSESSNTNIACGRTATLAVEAVGSLPLSYRWLRNGGFIDGATNSNFTATTSGTYSVIITNKYGLSISHNTQVVFEDVTPPTIVSCPPPQFVTASNAFVPDYAVSLVATDSCGIAYVSQSPAAGSAAISGTNIIKLFAVDQSGNTNTCDSLFVVNTPPVANTATYGRAKDLSLKILISDLLQTYATDADGDPLTLIGLGAAAHGSITTNSSWIFYLPDSNSSDSFTYTVSDQRGGQATSDVLINVVATGGEVQTVTSSGEVNVVSFLGIPGFLYDVEHSTNLLDWVVLDTVTAPASGAFQFTNVPAAPVGYYRLRQH